MYYLACVIKGCSLWFKDTNLKANHNTIEPQGRGG